MGAPTQYIYTFSGKTHEIKEIWSVGWHAAGAPPKSDTENQCLHLEPSNSGGFRISETGGANFQGGGTNLLFGQISPENCMKMKECGPSLAPPPLDPPLSKILYAFKWMDI